MRDRLFAEYLLREWIEGRADHAEEFVPDMVRDVLDEVERLEAANRRLETWVSLYKVQSDTWRIHFELERGDE